MGFRDPNTDWERTVCRAMCPGSGALREWGCWTGPEVLTRGASSAEPPSGAVTLGDPSGNHHWRRASGRSATPGGAVWAEQLFSEAKGITRHIRLPKMLNKVAQDVRLKQLTFIAQSGKESSCNAGDQGLIPVSGGSPGEGNGTPLRYSCLENSMDRGA